MCAKLRELSKEFVLTSSMGVWEGLLSVKSSGYTVPLHCVFTVGWVGFCSQCLLGCRLCFQQVRGGERTVTVDWVRYQHICLCWIVLHGRIPF
jgi:hypothetical protein